jgi:hypothetical protein
MGDKLTKAAHSAGLDWADKTGPGCNHVWQGE